MFAEEILGSFHSFEEFVEYWRAEKQLNWHDFSETAYLHEKILYSYIKQNKKIYLSKFQIVNILFALNFDIVEVKTILEYFFFFELTKEEILAFTAFNIIKSNMSSLSSNKIDEIKNILRN
jgi:hypothetical protein